MVDSRLEDSGKSITFPVHVLGQPRCWYVKDMAVIIYEDFHQDGRGRYTWTIFEEPQILTSSFGSVLILRYIIAQYRLDWLAAPWGKYSLALV